MNYLNQKRFRNPTDRQGGMLIFIAFVMIIFIVAAAFSVDVAYMHMVRAELRTATDAAARAGSETLSRTQDTDLAIAAAQTIAERNNVAGDGLTLNRNEILLGSVSEDPNGKLAFTAGGARPFAIQVVGRRDAGAPDSVVPLFFGNIFGVDSFAPVLDATASASVRDIALVLDRSGSMNRSSGSGTRLQALVAAVSGFLDEIERSSPNSTVSLTTYATSSSRDHPLDDNFATIRSRVLNMRASGLTNIFQGLRQGSDSLVQDPEGRQFGEKTIVLMTDGNFNEGGTPIPSANVAASRDHVIHTITFGGGANQAIMQQVAAIGNGTHIHADSAGDLTEAFREIAKTFSVLLTD